MTINVALITNDALVFGCDSTASTGDYYIDPFVIGLDRDSNGKFLVDADGKYVVRFDPSQMEHIVTDAWGGVTKMFHLCGNGCHVAAVTAGLAVLNGRTIASAAAEYASKVAKRKGVTKHQTVRHVAEEFLTFMRAEYDEHYKKSTMPADLQEGPEFLLGGYSVDEKFPTLYRLLVKENTIQDEFVNGDGGLAWNAQSDAVERIMRGYDRNLRSEVEKRVERAAKAYQADVNTQVLRILEEVLAKLNVTMPDGVDTTLPDQVNMTFPWEDVKLRVPYQALPLQEAVNFVSYLIFMQAGKSRFVRGVATVGGRTHIGVITKDKGYRQLNEPELTHRFTGFADDH
jgi:hypothetical protein